MGVGASRSKDFLDGSEWLRVVLQHHQQKRSGVSRFEAFTIEPAFMIAQTKSQDEDKVVSYQDGGVRLNRVSIAFRNNKDVSQSVFWIVKSAERGPRALQSLSHEIKINVSLLTEMKKFLASQSNPRARYLLNLPDFIYQEKRGETQNGRARRCYLVVEDVSKTKKCTPITQSSMQAGLTTAQFKVFLGTLAQFHAVGLAWRLHLRELPTELYSYLFKNPQVASLACECVEERERLLMMYERLLKWHYKRRKRSHENDLRRRIKLLSMLKSRASEILAKETDTKSELGGICLGPVLPSEVMFQHETKGDLISASSSSSLTELALEKDVFTTPHPTCAAVTTCHRVHFGNIVRELSLLFFTLSCANARRDYLIFLLQTYCFVLTSTLEVLNVDWIRHFHMTFPQFALAFYDNVPQAMLRSVILHMRMTDAKELDRLTMSSGEFQHRKEENAKVTRIYIPLTDDRIEFLVRITDPVYRSV